MNCRASEQRTFAPTSVSGAFDTSAVDEIASALTVLLANVFALFVKTKNFHWHVSGPHFRDHHRLLEEQGDQLFAATDVIAERVRKIGGSTLRSIGHIARLKRIADNDSATVSPRDMLAELLDDNRRLAISLRKAHTLCNDYGDVASASLIENWIDEAEHRTWFLCETTAQCTG
jgi:starvation-inducible DNA-binding protein